MPEQEKGYLGYGSPEALEQAIKAEEDETFRVLSERLCFATVCSSLPADEVAARMARRPSGTTGGWVISSQIFAPGVPNPSPCNQQADFKHYMFEC